MGSSHPCSSHPCSSHLCSSHLCSSHRCSSHLCSSHLCSSHLCSSHLCSGLLVARLALGICHRLLVPSRASAREGERDVRSQSLFRSTRRARVTASLEVGDGHS